MPITELGLRERVEKALLDAGVTSVRELVALLKQGKEAVLALPKIG